jgi:hypothetical protein
VARGVALVLAHVGGHAGPHAGLVEGRSRLAKRNVWRRSSPRA